MARRGRAVAGERQRSSDPAAEEVGGTRGSSKESGPESSAVPEKDSAVNVNKGDDAGSSSSEGRRDPEDRTAPEDDTLSRSGEPPRGPLPEGARPEDYLGGEKPHQTRRDGPTTGASGGRNDVL
jgi:hypothetical protein